jgi:hypothetical protein
VSSQTQYGHGGRHHGTGAPDCPRELHHHHDERCVSPLDARRQAAREAAFDAPNGPASGDIEPAIDAATRVQVTPEIVAAGSDADSAHSYGADYGAIIIAAFRAAGFEVVE